MTSAGVTPSASARKFITKRCVRMGASESANVIELRPHIGHRSTARAFAADDQTLDSHGGPAPNAMFLRTSSAGL